MEFGAVNPSTESNSASPRMKKGSVGKRQDVARRQKERRERNMYRRYLAQLLACPHSDNQTPPAPPNVNSPLQSIADTFLHDEGAVGEEEEEVEEPILFNNTVSESDVDSLLRQFESELGTSNEVVLTRSQLAEMLETFLEQRGQRDQDRAAQSETENSEYWGDDDGPSAEVGTKGRTRTQSLRNGGRDAGGGYSEGEIDPDESCRRGRDSATSRASCAAPTSRVSSDDAWMSDGSTACTCIHHSYKRGSSTSRTRLRRRFPDLKPFTELRPGTPPTPGSRYPFTPPVRSHSPDSYFSHHTQSTDTTPSPEVEQVSVFSDELKICRICLSDERQHRMLVPCKCAGSSRFIHRECLEQWRKASVNPMSKLQCDICKSFYRFKNRSIFMETGFTLTSARIICYVGYIAYYFAVLYLFAYFMRLVTSTIRWSTDNTHTAATLPANATLSRILNHYRTKIQDYIPAIKLLGGFHHFGSAAIALTMVLGAGDWGRLSVVVGTVYDLVYIAFATYGAVTLAEKTELKVRSQAPKLLLLMVDVNNGDAILG